MATTQATRLKKTSDIIYYLIELRHIHFLASSLSAFFDAGSLSFANFNILIEDALSAKILVIRDWARRMPKDSN
jgi:hypothetical protein